MPISRNVRRSMDEGGWIRRMFEAGIALKAQYGADQVFDLSLGNPIVEPPEQFKQELVRLRCENQQATSRTVLAPDGNGRCAGTGAPAKREKRKCALGIGIR